VEWLWRNVKYEDIYLKGYANMGELMLGLTQYMTFYNQERPHQSLGYSTPNEAYRTSIGGGALIVDKFGDAGKEPSVSLRSTDGSLPAEAEAKAETATKAEAEAKDSKLGQRNIAACDLNRIA
jgi:putative transposase